MLRQTLSTAALIALTSAVPAMAADDAKSLVNPANPVNSVNIVNPVVDAAAVSSPSAAFRFAPASEKRGTLLPALYVSLAGLNAYDAFSTTRGVARGAVEGNGLMKGAAGTPAAMWAIKGGLTAGSILVSERLWKTGRKMQAVGMMLATNGLMAVVGAHNSRVMGQMK